MAVKYNKDRFKEMLVNPEDYKKNQALLTNVDIFTENKVFAAPIDSTLEEHRTKILRYITVAFDRKSPFNEIEHYQSRLIECALYSGFKPEGKHFRKDIKEMVQGYNNEVNAMIIKYCMLQSPTKWAMMTAARSQFENALIDMVDRDDRKAKDRKLIWDQAKVVEADLEGYRREFLNYDDSKGLDDDLWRVVDRHVDRDIKLSPEDMAK